MAFVYNEYERGIIPHRNILNAVREHIVEEICYRRKGKYIRLTTKIKVCPLWIIYVRGLNELVREILKDVAFPFSNNHVYNFRALFLLYLSEAREMETNPEYIRFKEEVSRALLTGGKLPVISQLLNILRGDEIMSIVLRRPALSGEDMKSEDICFFTNGPPCHDYERSLAFRREKGLFTDFTYAVEPESIAWATKKYFRYSDVDDSEYRAYLQRNSEKILRDAAMQRYVNVFNMLNNHLSPTDSYVSDHGIRHHLPVMNRYQELTETLFRDVRLWRYVKGDKSMNTTYSFVHEETRDNVRERTGRLGAEPIIAFGTEDKHWAFTVTELTTCFTPGIDGVVTFRKPAGLNSEGAMFNYSNFHQDTIFSLRNFLNGSIGIRYLPIIYEKLLDNVELGLEQQRNSGQIWNNLQPRQELKPFVAWLFYLGVYCRFWQEGRDWHAPWNEDNLSNVELMRERENTVQAHLELLHTLIKGYPGLEGWTDYFLPPPLSRCYIFDGFPVCDKGANIIPTDWEDIIKRVREGRYCLSELTMHSTSTAYYYVQRVFRMTMREFLLENNILHLERIPDFDIELFGNTGHHYVDIEDI